MYLKQLEIEGYKNFRNPFIITFCKGLNVLVGENGSGKSAIIDAIRLLLPEDDFGRNSISDTDFNHPFDNPAEQADSFRFRALFDNLSDQEKVAFLPWINLDGQASLTLLVENRADQRGRYKRALWGGASRSSVFESELFETIDCIYLPPLRDAEAKLKEGKSSRLARLLKNLNRQQIEQARQNNQLHPLENTIKQIHKQLASDKNGTISKANELIRNRLIDAVGTVFGQDTQIQFSETNFNRIVESLRLLFFPEANASIPPEQFRSLEENSLGYNNLLYLATVLAQFTEGADEPEYLRVFLIEEPEAHLHPQLLIMLLRYLEKNAATQGVQVIVTTHSPVLASSVSLNSLIHLSAANREPTAIPLADCCVTEESHAFLSRWLDVTKSTLLFARSVILVEGIGEAMLLPELAKQVLGDYNSKLSADSPNKLPCSLEHGGVSVINMNGIYFKHFMQLYVNLNENEGHFIPLRCAGITDNDPSSQEKPTPSHLVKGENPALALIDKVNTSEWARLYPNKLKTFEYDLAMEADNLKILIPIAKSLVGTDGPIKETFNEYERTDWSKAGEGEKADAAYYLLVHIEKGEFCQAVAHKLSTSEQSLKVPEYICKAVVWACGGLPDDT